MTAELLTYFDSNLSGIGSSLLGEYTTIGGLLCSLHGRIPRSGTKIRFAEYIFTILKVEDHRRVHEILAEPVKPVADPGSIPKLPRRVNGSSSIAGTATNDNRTDTDEMTLQDDDFMMPESIDNDSAYSFGDEGDLDVPDSVVNGMEEDDTDSKVNSSSPIDHSSSFIDGEWVDENV